MKLVEGGLSLGLPRGWEARARRQPPSRAGHPGNVLLHAATIAIPEQRGDFGSGLVEHLGPDDAFVALFEYDQHDASAVLFRSSRVPVPRPSDFTREALQRPQGNNSGAQWFFQTSGRAFCLHAVIGSHARRSASAARVAELLQSLTIGPAR